VAVRARFSTQGFALAFFRSHLWCDICGDLSSLARGEAPGKRPIKIEGEPHRGDITMLRICSLREDIAPMGLPVVLGTATQGFALGCFRSRLWRGNLR